VNSKLRDETREKDRLEGRMTQIEEEVRVITKSHLRSFLFVNFPILFWSVNCTLYNVDCIL
jgi:hypothetical protein